MERLNLGNGRRLRQTRLRQGSVEIFYAMVADRDHHQAGVALGFQVKFLIEDRKIDPFNRHGVETHAATPSRKLPTLRYTCFAIH